MNELWQTFRSKLLSKEIPPFLKKDGCFTMMQFWTFTDAHDDQSKLEINKFFGELIASEEIKKHDEEGPSEMEVEAYYEVLR